MAIVMEKLTKSYGQKLALPPFSCRVEPGEIVCLLGQFGITLANVLLYIALALTVISGADYLIRNRDCIKDM